MYCEKIDSFLQSIEESVGMDNEEERKTRSFG